jgi:superfamily II DNA or RNA helicase
LAAFDAEPVVVLQGVSASARREAKRQLAVITDADERVVIATGRYIGEGFDDARLDALFLALPVSWRGTLIQYAGRRLCYARGEAPLGLGDAGDDLVVEYDEGALRALKERDDFI